MKYWIIEYKEWHVIYPEHILQFEQVLICLQGTQEKLDCCKHGFIY